LKNNFCWIFFMFSDLPTSETVLVG
jgi:hypothetical protein